MYLRKILSKENIKRLAGIITLIIIAVLSMTVVSKFATSPQSYKNTIQSIDEKKGTVRRVCFFVEV